MEGCNPKAIERLTGQGKEGKNGPQGKNLAMACSKSLYLCLNYSAYPEMIEKVVVSESTRFLLYNYLEY